MVCQIKSILAQLDVSQQVLADALGVSRNTITSLARNQSLPNLRLAYDIRDFFNAKAAELGMDKRWSVEDIWVE
ncbi:helix-turn-helix domain-containing protein [Paenibacillus cisolokensis]|uniref:helix-turn-helix transcriptional regulator n=1 Tax=Paenibacillus cisolokensis TaxID=1658519 RepID=UPI003D28B4EF